MIRGHNLVVPMFDERKSWSKEERFFIRKSIGWALRGIANAFNVEQDVVFGFLKKYKERMFPLTFREGSRKLPQAYINQLSS